MYNIINNMTDKRIGKIYNSVINNITKKIKTQNNCMKRVTNNPDYIYMLGNKCIKPNTKSRRNHRYNKKYNNKKSKRVKYQRGGVFGNLQNGTNVITSGIREVSPPVSVLPWEGHFTRNFLKT